MNRPALTLYYDGNCSLCRAQMRRFSALDHTSQLAFADIAAPEFSALEAGASLDAMRREIHARTADGRLLVGIDSLLAAYTAIGRGWRVAPLRLRILRPLFTALYRTLARNRYRLSACADGVCNMAGKA